MAHVDLKSGKIYGCKPYSLVWWHEKGHLEYNKRFNIDRNNWTMETSFVYSVITLVVSQFWDIFKWLSLSFMLVAISYFLAEEIWCWIYAFNKRFIK